MSTRSLDTGTSHLIVEIENGVAVLTLNQPERRNALSEEMLDALGDALAECETASDVRCIVLTGAGGAFCAGGDVKAFAEVGALEVGGEDAPLHEKIEHQRLQQRATAGRLHSMSKPTIACLEGAAAGAGLGLALACDLRVASERTVLVTAFARVGLSGDYGVSWFLTRLLGTSRALELMVLSERVPAERAEQLGLVNWVAPTGGALDRSLALARDLASGPAIAIHAIKGAINAAVSDDLLVSMDREVDDAMRCAASRDHADAVAALAAGQTPVFRGR